MWTPYQAEHSCDWENFGINTNNVMYMDSFCRLIFMSWKLNMNLCKDREYRYICTIFKDCLLASTVLGPRELKMLDDTYL